MDTTAVVTHRSGIRRLVLLPVAIDLAASPRGCPAAVGGAGGGVDPAQTWRVLAQGARRFLHGQQAAHIAGARYPSDESCRPWLLLAAGGSDAQTLGRTFRPGTTYRLSLACADVFGCPAQQLTIAVTGGAVASATFSIPANGSADGAWSFVLCGLDFTPTSEEALTVRLTNSAAMAATSPLPDRSRLRV